MEKNESDNSSQPEMDPDENTGSDEAVKKAVVVSIFVLLGIGLVGGGAYGIYRWMNSGEDPIEDVKPTREVRVRRVAIDVPSVMFTDITDDCGVNFVHTNGNVGKKLLPQTMGGGVAFLDFDNDEDQDLFFVNSSYWEGDQPGDKPVPTMALYENDGTGKFTDVTKKVGLDVSFYGMGVAVGDFDNDGWVDLYITAVGPNHLFRNDKGKFKDVTAAAGVAGKSGDWGTTCGFFDYNRDGRLDLVVCNYLDWTAEDELAFEISLTPTIPGYVKPNLMAGVYPYLFRNDGNGKFSEVAKEAGMHVDDPLNKKPLNKSLGLSFVDVNDDGWLDVFFANDTVRNLLYVNQKNGRFKEQGEDYNIAYDDEGKARGAMGIDAARFRSDDSLGFVIGNFSMEPASLYVKEGAIFTDESLVTGLGPETQVELTFGMFFFDFDLDGRLDILAANGHLEEEIHRKFQSQKYKQAPHLFWNAGEDQRTEFVTVNESKCGEDICKPIAGRGLSYADIDGDGDLDVVITAVNDRPRILRNDQDSGNHWLQIKLDNGPMNRDAFGARIRVFVGEKKMERWVSPTRSYLSQTQIPVNFGLGKAEMVDRIEIFWPDGNKTEMSGLGVDQYLRISKPEVPKKNDRP